MQQFYIEMFTVSVNKSILLLGLLCFPLYWYLTKNFQYWKKRNIKGNKPFPLIGTLGSELLTESHPALIAQKLYQQYPDEKMVGAFLTATPLLMVRDPEIIKGVLVKDFNNFQCRGFRSNEVREPLTRNIFLGSNANEWKILRHKFTPTFSTGKMRSMLPLITECGQQFEQYLSDVVSQGRIPDIKKAMDKYTTAVVGSCVFGINMNSFEDEITPFIIMGNKIFNPSLWARIKLVALIFVPSVHYFLQFRITDMKVQNFFIELVKSVMQTRYYKPSSRNDLIDIFIQLKSENHAKNITKDTTTEILMTDEILAAHAFIFFAAVYDTSSTTMTFALYELAKNPHILENLVNEIIRVLSKFKGKITYEALKEMTYLRMVIDETLRKYPPATSLQRVCNTKCTITGTDFELDENVLIEIPVHALHHDPQYFPEPEKFIPERFTPEAVAKRHPFVYLPFGGGPRTCIGMRFGLLQVMVGLISVLRNYKVCVNDKTVEKPRLCARAFVTTSLDEIYLTMEKHYIRI